MMRKWKKILLPIDGSQNSLLAAKYGLELAQTLGAEVILLYIVPKLSRYFYPQPENYVDIDYLIQEYRKEAEYIVENAQKELSSSNGTPPKAIILWGEPAFEICKLAWESNYDLIVMGRRGLTEIKEYLLGSVSMRVVRRARCPVLVVP